ncbi:MAG: cupredoxin domain-containing protein [Bacteroidetes bacterium]|nr:cupredoxin domain-containing protein [Bacteroidota bacterium]
MKTLKSLSNAWLMIMLFSTLIITNSCSKSSDGSNTTPTTPTPTPGSSPGTNEVWMQNLSFVPSSKTVAVGTTITWTNKDSDMHDVFSNTGLFQSPSFGLGGTYSYQFNTAGTYTYKCTFHAGMTGTIIVQ